MTDRSAKIAEYLIESRGVSSDERKAEIIRRFPAFKPDEMRRAAKSARSLLSSENAELLTISADLTEHAKARIAIKREIVRRRRIARVRP